MNSNFPNINNISDVLPHLDDRPEFIVAERDGYTVVNYNVMLRDTFPDLDDPSGAILRECRGIIFCSVTGDVIRRPLHKFFNVGERSETFLENVDWSKPHVILEKLDGSMIAPFFLNGDIRWGTKMGCTDVAQPVEEFVKNNTNYIELAENLMDPAVGGNITLQPIFEWCSRKQRIVMDYPEDQLVLTAVRVMHTGEYVPYEMMRLISVTYNIPVVSVFDPGKKTPKEVIEYVKAQEGLEGFVIRFDDGQMIKTKSDWYVQIHRAKEAIMKDRNIVGLIIDNLLDDIKSAFPADERTRLETFEGEVQKRIEGIIVEIMQVLHEHKLNNPIDRKTFAINIAPGLDPLTKSAVFSVWDEPNSQNIFETVINTIRKHLSNTERYDILCVKWFNGVKYNA